MFVRYSQGRSRKPLGGKYPDEETMNIFRRHKHRISSSWLRLLFPQPLPVFRCFSSLTATAGSQLSAVRALITHLCRSLNKQVRCPGSPGSPHIAGLAARKPKPPSLGSGPRGQLGDPGKRRSGGACRASHRRRGLVARKVWLHIPYPSGSCEVVRCGALAGGAWCLQAQLGVEGAQ